MFQAKSLPAANKLINIKQNLIANFDFNMFWTANIIASLENCTFYLGAWSLNITTETLLGSSERSVLFELWTEPFFGITNMAA